MSQENFTMNSEEILRTERMVIRKFNLGDAIFIIHLMNTPGWLQFIGDRNMKSIDDAKNYLVSGPLQSYEEHGFGLWMVELINSKTPIGMCGLLKRETLEDIDIGYALLPDYVGQGYAFEMAAATLLHAKNNLKINKVVAITDGNNVKSIGLLNKLGLQFEREIEHADKTNTHLYS